MTKKRIQIPQTIQSELLYKNRHTCCICRNNRNDAQVHHIDKDPSNNDYSNLAVLCINCHSSVMKSGGLGKIFKKDEIVKYKEDWEKYCKDNPIIFKKKKKGMKKEINNKLDFYILFSCELKDMISKLEYFIEAAIPYCNKTEKEKYWNEGNKILYDFETLYEKYRIFSNLRLDDKMKILFNNLKEAIKQSSYSQIHYSSFDKNNDYKHWAKAVELSDNASKLISITYKIRNEIIDEIRNVLK